MQQRLRLFLTHFIPHDRFNVDIVIDCDDAEQKLRATFGSDLGNPTTEIVGECSLTGEEEKFLGFLRRMEFKENLAPEESYGLSCVKEFVDDELEKAHPSGDMISIAKTRQSGKRERFMTILCEAEQKTEEYSIRVLILKRIAKKAVALLPQPAAT